MAVLKPEEQTKFDLKMNELATAQVVDKARWVQNRNLNKQSEDENWKNYVAKQLAWYDKYLETERRRFRVQFTRALLDARKGKFSPLIDVA